MRRFSIFFAVLLSLLCTKLLAEHSRPNILFIMSDDHAYQAISAYGSKLTKTPNIDRIAASGMRFDRCYVTNSICGPSRACILTGKYSHKNGYYFNEKQFNVDQQIFPKLLQQAGYQTAILGKWHLGIEKLPQGFDYYRILKGHGSYFQPMFITPLGPVNEVGHVSELITKHTLAWLEQGRDREKPFLLMMHHKAPHRNWAPAIAHLDDFTETTFTEPETLFDDYKHRASAAKLAEMRIADHLFVAGADLKAWDQPSPQLKKFLRERDWFYNGMTVAQQQAWKKSYLEKNEPFYSGTLKDKNFTRWKYQRYMQDYLSCAASIDESVGQVLDYLDKSGLAENTIVVYCSDQGMYLGEHGWFDKRFMYEESLRTPLLVRWPGVTKAGVVDKHIVSNLDFAETFLDAAGVDVPADMQGRSFVPLLAGTPPQDWRKSFYYHYYEGFAGTHAVCEHYGVTDGRYKLIHFYKIDEWELFDLEHDPQEMHSVYADPEYAPVKEKLLRELQRLRDELQVTSNDPT